MDDVPGKTSVRARLLARRDALSATARDTAAAQVLGHLLTMLDALPRSVDGTLLVAAYLPFGAEPGGPHLPDALRAAGATVLLPVLRADNDLDWARYTQAADLAEGRRGLREPAGPTLGVAAVREATLVIVPALAVDRRGVRLGRGGGSYDRALARVAQGGATVALLHDGELLDEVPTHPHDQRVRAVITPSAGWCDLPDISRSAGRGAGE
jgi:5-formyltetrahydrofolate cyclo-ligase